MNYINIKIRNERYIQRSEFSKITIENDNGAKYFVTTVDELPEFQKNIIQTLIEIKNHPDNFFEFTRENGQITITKYIGNSKYVVIPEEIDEFKVCNVDNIFNRRDEIEAIIIPDTITTLPDRFCAELEVLKFVQLSKNIKEIPIECFSRCYKLKYINLENINEIGSYGFFNCVDLNKINLDNIETIRPFALSYCIGLKSINIPKAIAIHPNAFVFCENLKNVVLNDNISVIKESIFANCKSLEKINLPNNLTRIEPKAFAYCTSLKEITFPQKLEKIENGAFYSSGLDSVITLPSSLKNIGSNAFFNDTLKQANIARTTRYKSNSFHHPNTSVVRYDDEIKRTNASLGEER